MTLTEIAERIRAIEGRLFGSDYVATSDEAYARSTDANKPEEPTSKVMTPLFPKKDTN